MKKLIVLFTSFVLLITTLSAQAQNIPQWSEFCPQEYLNTQKLPLLISTKKQMTGGQKAICLLTFPIGLIPYAIWNQNSDIDRKNEEIEKHNNNLEIINNKKRLYTANINACQSLPKNQQDVCYDKIRKTESLEPVYTKGLVLLTCSLDVELVNSDNDIFNRENITKLFYVDSKNQLLFDEDKILIFGNYNFNDSYITLKTNRTTDDNTNIFSEYKINRVNGFIQSSQKFRLSGFNPYRNFDAYGKGYCKHYIVTRKF